jgi:hypothetical protein
VTLEDALTLIYLGGDPFLQLVESRKGTNLRITLHLNQITGDRPGV